MRAALRYRPISEVAWTSASSVGTSRLNIWAFHPRARLDRVSGASSQYVVVTAMTTRRVHSSGRTRALAWRRQRVDEVRLQSPRDGDVLEEEQQVLAFFLQSLPEHPQQVDEGHRPQPDDLGRRVIERVGEDGGRGRGLAGHTHDVQRAHGLRAETADRREVVDVVGREARVVPPRGALRRPAPRRSAWRGGTRRPPGRRRRLRTPCSRNSVGR